MLNKKIGFISMFTGAGGLDIGLREAGFYPALSIEKDEICRTTLILNDRKIKLSTEGDIFKLSSEQIITESGFKKMQLPLLVGGPPCQPFSKSSYWANPSKSRMTDPRAQCIVEFMRVVDDLLPEVVLIENVTGIGYSDKNDGLEYVKLSFKKINEKNNVQYNPIIHVINAADYGVPQVRKRLFIIASRRGASFEIPEARFYDPSAQNDNRNGMQPYRTAWDAIGDLDIDICYPELKLRGKWAELLPSIPEGKNYLWHTKKMGGLPLFGWRTRYWSFLLKLDKNKPSWTITASPGPATGPFHWENRNLSIRELARIQTYPDWYQFKGTYGEQRKQIGNSVPPALGELFGLEIRRQLFGGRVRNKLRLIPHKNLNQQPREILRQVPKKYLALTDDHLEHPGVGKGPGAQRR